MEGNNVYLPHEIVVGILKRLPAKSLFRFQCVCKDWKHHLKDPLFIADHLQHSSHRPSLLLHRPCLINEQFRSLDCDLQLRVIDLAQLIDYSPINQDDLWHVEVVGSSGGLLCLSCDFQATLLVWNPSIKEEVRDVPINNVPEVSWTSKGFGFNMIANDYKIIKIYCYKSYHDGICTKGVSGVEVYSLSNGLWKRVGFGALEGVYVYSGAATASNGDVFWVGERHSDESFVMILFDIATEVFTVIPMPALNPSSVIKPTVYDNKLAILSYYVKEGGSCSIHLWVTEESTTGGRWRWTEKYSSGEADLSHNNLLPLNIWRNEIAFIDYGWDVLGGDGRILYLLNINSNEFEEFVIDNYSFCFGIEAYNHVESLVSVDKLK